MREDCPWRVNNSGLVPPWNDFFTGRNILVGTLTRLRAPASSPVRPLQRPRQAVRDYLLPRPHVQRGEWWVLSELLSAPPPLGLVQVPASVWIGRSPVVWHMQKYDIIREVGDHG